jgi:hypothetical protein
MPSDISQNEDIQAVGKSQELESRQPRGCGERIFGPERQLEVTDDPVDDRVLGQEIDDRIPPDDT